MAIDVLEILYVVAGKSYCLYFLFVLPAGEEHSICYDNKMRSINYLSNAFYHNFELLIYLDMLN